MKGFPDASIDCVVTDPPYGIGFMGKDWDQALPPKQAFQQMFRVLKSGALAFVMSSPRQDVLWRMLRMLEECGFVLGQSFISWIYKSGFPKAYDVSKGIDKRFKAEREVIGLNPSARPNWKTHDVVAYQPHSDNETYLTKPATDLAKEWRGYKSVTGLKPALECVLMVQKPLSEPTIVDNVLRHGVGAMNVDACRIPFQTEDDYNESQRFANRPEHRTTRGTSLKGSVDGSIDYINNPSNQKGRFPANLICSDGALDTGTITKGNRIEKPSMCDEEANTWGGTFQRNRGARGYDDVGDQSRYFSLDAWAAHHGFLDVPKASKSERDKGLEKTKFEGIVRFGSESQSGKMLPSKAERIKSHKIKGNYHPTVKPIKLMAYLISLGCPTDGIVLDPFCGSGSTLIAAHQLQRDYIGVEIREEYVEIAEARLAYWVLNPIDQEIYERRIKRRKKTRHSQKLVKWIPNA